MRVKPASEAALNLEHEDITYAEADGAWGEISLIPTPSRRAYTSHRFARESRQARRYRAATGAVSSLRKPPDWRAQSSE